ncbi:MAG: hypothetical protein H6732_13125 [Alphaproteobacteria bacterium]|nr:hypothetical protein [Alphaproteobacteria bacterium]
MTASLPRLAGLLLALAACRPAPTCDAAACAGRCEATADEAADGDVLTQYELARLDEALRTVGRGVRPVEEGVVLCRGTGACDEVLPPGAVGMLDPGRYLVSAHVVAPEIGTWELVATLTCEISTGEVDRKERRTTLRGGEVPERWTAFELDLQPLYKQDRGCDWVVRATSSEQSPATWSGAFLWPRVVDKDRWGE